MKLATVDCAGQNTQVLLSILVKHLDHKNVLKQPEIQLDIVQVVTVLARMSKVQSSVAIVSAVSDIMRHLRKSIHNRIDDANLGKDLVNWNKKFHEAVDECLIELSSKVTRLFSSRSYNRFGLTSYSMSRWEMQVSSLMLWLVCWRTYPASTLSQEQLFRLSIARLKLSLLCLIYRIKTRQDFVHH